MKRLGVILGALIAAVCLVGNYLPAFAGVNDFYFKDFTGDYYLTKDADGISHLRVVESVTAVFPDFNQNKGICRQIPFTNQNGKNITLENLNRSNLKLTRNGASEPIYSISREGNYYNVCTGDDDYVLGEQVYTFEYEFTKVVTEFEKDGREWQELYWDTNGNGSLQRFDSVTARVHFENPEVYTGESWCYVGKYGESGQDRCTITKISDGVEFTAKKLTPRENLTFDVELKAGSFVIPGPEKNYIYVWLTIVVALIGLSVIVYYGWKFAKTRDKARYYNGLFVKPEYQPSDKYRLTELAEMYMGKKKDMKVAMLLEMIVNGNIVLKKGEKKKWSIIVKDTIGLGKEDVSLLEILNGGGSVKDGDEIEVKRRSATSRLVALKKVMEDKILSNLKSDGLVEKGYRIGVTSEHGVKNVIVLATSMVLLVTFFAIVLLSFVEDGMQIEAAYGQELVFWPYFYKTNFAIIVATVVICVLLWNATKRYERRTKEGLKAARYMDGLKLYIEMAEAERIKFLQSVETADVSAEGIVKLYEQLLPYAAVFGLEESWMNEMKKYCEVEDIVEPDYLTQGIIISDLMRGLRTASAIATTSTVMSSSGGGSSSGFSGGGGGGFSGGGGGGGGFSGR